MRPRKPLKPIKIHHTHPSVRIHHIQISVTNFHNDKDKQEHLKEERVETNSMTSPSRTQFLSWMVCCLLISTTVGWVVPSCSSTAGVGCASLSSSKRGQVVRRNEQNRLYSTQDKGKIEDDNNIPIDIEDMNPYELDEITAHGGSAGGRGHTVDIDEYDGENDYDQIDVYEKLDDFWGQDDLEVLQGQGDDFFEGTDDTEADWIPDKVRAELKRQNGPASPYLTPANEVIAPSKPESDVDGEMVSSKTYTPEAGANSGTKTSSQQQQQKQQKPPSAYTEEEEEIIEAMGGRIPPAWKRASQENKKQEDEKIYTEIRKKEKTSGRRKREEGYLGDSTLAEIARDYSVPACYLADVLCMWGVPVPINIHDRLGDLVTGEQAFAVLEAVNSLDIGVLQDRYSNSHMLQLCEEWEMELKAVFEYAMKEGWSLPFGVRTFLRVEQEEEVLRTFSHLYGG